MVQTKQSPEQSHYTMPGPYPFVCSNCRHYQKDGSCEIVDGPDNGKVQPQATCQNWQGKGA